MNRMTTGLRALFLIVVVVSLAGASAFGLATAKKTTDGWPQFKGCSISSIAWSPDGNNIAFVVMKRSGVDENNVLMRASIWSVKVNSIYKKPVLSRVIELSAKEGIPCALFWTSPTEIAWPGATNTLYDLRKSFNFYVIRLGEHKYRRLIDKSFSNGQCGLEGIYGPDDVYWDAKSKCVAYSFLDSQKNKPFISKTYLKTGETALVPVDTESSAPWNGITFCGLPGEEKKSSRFAFTSSVDSKDDTITNCLWITTGEHPSVGSAKIIARSDDNIQFPRISSAGDKIAFLQVGPGGDEDSVIVLSFSDVRKSISTRTVVIHDSDVDIGLGCPFAWSPDGKMIAYAYGSRVRVFTP